MVDKQTVLQEYEEMLMGNRKTFGNVFPKEPLERKKAITFIWRYAIEDIIGWSLQDAAKYMTYDIAVHLRLNYTLKHFDFKPETKRNKDFEYVLSILFPKEVKYDASKKILDEYFRVAKLGPYKDSTEKHILRKNFFNGEDGAYVAATCLLATVTLFKNECTIPELYDFFADSVAATKFLKKVKLDKIIKEMYETPLEYFHYSLSQSEQDDFLFNYYQYIDIYKNITITDDGYSEDTQSNPIEIIQS